MFKDEKRILWFSFLVSLIFHISIFSILYFVNLKPQPEKEKIITISLDTENLTQKPFINPEKVEKKEEKPVVRETQKPAPQPQPTPKPQPQVQPQPEPHPASTIPESKPPVKSETTESVNPQPQPPAIPKSEDSITPQPQTPPQKVDLSAGRPDQFKTPPKKDEDINGYLKDLIRWLNQQARERDLYPPIAKRLKIEGEVIVRVTINEDGTIDENSIVIVEGSGYNVLDKGAIDILKKLQPLKKPPKRITVEIPIVFQIIYM
ncbi:MAG: energy transducer TonB [Hydrogenothermaceae bacterium]|nr:energy transducer TonB [Hydrogenothermaceae bacterium]